MAYATPQDLLIRYDERRVADLVSDTGTRSATPLTSPVVAAVLEDAAGILDSACRVGGRYSLTDLANMSGSGHSLLVRLSCDIAYSLLVARRGYSTTDMKVMAPQMEWATKMLDDIRKGDRVLDIFGFPVTPGGGTGTGGGTGGGTGNGGSNGTGGGTGTGGSNGTGGTGTNGVPDAHSALTCPRVMALKARTLGYYSGTDTVGLSSRLWGKRNPN
jgi:phage gp36-like protein